MPDSNPRTVTVERFLPHSRQKVWHALTQGALIVEWLMTNDFQPVVGHRFTFRAEPSPQWNGVVACEVLVVQALEQLSYTWNASGQASAGELQTVVTWTLTPVPGGTLLRMEQSGFGPEQESNYKGARHGWPRLIAALDALLAKLP
jgi:uncharacterized protein YndB with AHSA1/START domain